MRDQTVQNISVIKKNGHFFKTAIACPVSLFSLSLSLPPHLYLNQSLLIFLPNVNFMLLQHYFFPLKLFSSSQLFNKSSIHAFFSLFFVSLSFNSFFFFFISSNVSLSPSKMDRVVKGEVWKQFQRDASDSTASPLPCRPQGFSTCVTLDISRLFA